MRNEEEDDDVPSWDNKMNILSRLASILSSERVKMIIVWP